MNKNLVNIQEFVLDLELWVYKLDLKHKKVQVKSDEINRRVWIEGGYEDYIRLINTGEIFHIINKVIDNKVQFSSAIFKSQ